MSEAAITRDAVGLEPEVLAQLSILCHMRLCVYCGCPVRSLFYPSDPDGPDDAFEWVTTWLAWYDLEGRARQLPARYAGQALLTACVPCARAYALRECPTCPSCVFPRAVGRQVVWLEKPQGYPWRAQGGYAVRTDGFWWVVTVPKPQQPRPWTLALQTISVTPDAYTYAVQITNAVSVAPNAGGDFVAHNNSTGWIASGGSGRYAHSVAPDRCDLWASAGVRTQGNTAAWNVDLVDGSNQYQARPNGTPLRFLVCPQCAAACPPGAEVS